MFHRITLIGRVGQEPQMRYTPEGTPVTSFSVATTKMISKNTRETCPAGWKESYNGKNWELTIWWRVTCWRGLAETVNAYLSKGRQVFVEGEIGGDAENGTQNPRVWTGNDGVARASYEMTADTVKFLGGRDDVDVRSGGPTSEGPEEGLDEDTLPF
jgi:single-strand DNA-binding protein